MIRSRLLPVAALALLAAGCANPREDARGELRRLRTALDQHAAKFGRYPQTLEPSQPESAGNLPHRAEKGVTLRLVHAGADGIQALGKRGQWVCSLNVDAQRRERLRCAPLTGDAANRPLEPAGDVPSVVGRRDTTAAP
ncbi:MAG TPA: hypothetical protein VJT67_02950 [Longimicrobiaceae bacterium]|nr:hypothetical protein [Longimicrobiaceae bacterium]